MPQVFSKLQPKADCWSWDIASSDRTLLLEPFWLKLITLSWDSDLAQDACVPILGAACASISLSEIRAALTRLFSCTHSLHAAAGVFSELAWQIQDQAFHLEIASSLQKAQVGHGELHNII